MQIYVFFLLDLKIKILYLHPHSGNEIKDLIAQLVEHNTFNVGVLGSSPSQVTKLNEFQNAMTQ